MKKKFAPKPSGLTSTDTKSKSNANATVATDEDANGKAIENGKAKAMPKSKLNKKAVKI